MSWHFSQALVAEYLVANSSDGEQSVQWNMSHTPSLFSPNDKMMEFCNHSQSGMTCGPLTENHGKELLTWFLGGFPVKILAPLEVKRESKEAGQDSGQKWQESLTKYDPNTHSWKIHQCLLFGGLEEFSEIWPRWGIIQNGECLELQPPEAITIGNVSGLLPTPLKSNGERFYGTHLRKEQTWEAPGNLACLLIGFWKGLKGRQGVGIKIDKMTCHPILCEWIMHWPINWTELCALGMDKFQQWLDLYGKS